MSVKLNLLDPAEALFEVCRLHFTGEMTREDNAEYQDLYAEFNRSVNLEPADRARLFVDRFPRWAKFGCIRYLELEQDYTRRNILSQLRGYIQVYSLDQRNADEGDQYESPEWLVKARKALKDSGWQLRIVKVAYGQGSSMPDLLCIELCISDPRIAK